MERRFFFGSLAALFGLPALAAGGQHGRRHKRQAQRNPAGKGPQCSNCQFSVGNSGALTCQKNPPTLYAVGSQVKADWPAVADNDWCGQYEWGG